MRRKRIPMRMLKSFDNYEVKTGSAGFVQLFKNGKRILPKNISIRFNNRLNEMERK